MKLLFALLLILATTVVALRPLIATVYQPTDDQNLQETWIGHLNPTDFTQKKGQVIYRNTVFVPQPSNYLSVGPSSFDKTNRIYYQSTDTFIIALNLKTGGLSIPFGNFDTWDVVYDGPNNRLIYLDVYGVNVIPLNDPAAMHNVVETEATWRFFYGSHYDSKNNLYYWISQIVPQNGGTWPITYNVANLSVPVPYAPNAIMPIDFTANCPLTVAPTSVIFDTVAQQFIILGGDYTAGLVLARMSLDGKCSVINTNLVAPQQPYVFDMLYDNVAQTLHVPLFTDLMNSTMYILDAKTGNTLSSTPLPTGMTISSLEFDD